MKDNEHTKLTAIVFIGKKQAVNEKISSTAVVCPARCHITENDMVETNIEHFMDV